jgi:hypothetical protein
VVVAFRNTTEIGNRDFDLYFVALSLVVKNSTRSYCEISVCNNKIAREELPIMSSDEKDLIGTSYYGSWPQSACLLCQNSKRLNRKSYWVNLQK